MIGLFLVFDPFAKNFVFTNVVYRREIGFLDAKNVADRCLWEKGRIKCRALCGLGAG